ncbi:hypothetical protein, partial [Candidatus Protofrankia datiscae]|uniref:hypothetical protein n=2 Tax=Candidatus Protofrankia datiscae TaxID=2716812 RepID=UPI0019CFF3CA
MTGDQGSLKFDIINDSEERELPGATLTLIRRILADSDLKFVEYHSQHYAADSDRWVVRSDFETTSIELAELWIIARRFELLLRWPISGEADKENTILALRAGRPEVILGLVENEWLDVKQMLPDITTELGKIEMSKDVAQFGNSRHGGILVFGFRTKRRPGGADEICRFTPFSASLRELRSIRDILYSRIVTS